MDKNGQLRQGDVFCEKISKSQISANAKEKQFNGIIAYGEVTGHCHKIVNFDPSKVSIKIDDTTGDIYAMAPDGMEIEHDEHGTVNLDAGEWYVISRQREYDPLAAERERQVRD